MVSCLSRLIAHTMWCTGCCLRCSTCEGHLFVLLLWGRRQTPGGGHEGPGVAGLGGQVWCAQQTAWHILLRVLQYVHTQSILSIFVHGMTAGVEREERSLTEVPNLHATVTVSPWVHHSSVFDETHLHRYNSKNLKMPTQCLPVVSVVNSMDRPGWLSFAGGQGGLCWHP